MLGAKVWRQMRKRMQSLANMMATFQTPVVIWIQLLPRWSRQVDWRHSGPALDVSFFGTVWGIRPPDEWIVDRERWLDPLQLGNLVHGLFEQFLGKLTVDGSTPSANRDRQLLLDSLHARIETLKADIPIPNDDVYRRTCDLLEEVCEIFLEKEEEYCRANDARPWVLEASLGLANEPKTELDCREPIPLTLSGGRLIRVGGRLDRVDKLTVHGSERVCDLGLQIGIKLWF